MKLMGWKGGGIGKDQQGRLDPVEVSYFLVQISDQSYVKFQSKWPFQHNQSRSGWDKSCIGVDDQGRCKVDRENAEVFVARYAKSEIMEGRF